MKELVLDSVSLSYDVDDGKVDALDDVSLRIEGGESVALIGPSGCGKSSLLRMVSGLIAPSSGTLVIDGRPVGKPREQTSLILQDFGLLPWKSVRANAELGLKVRKLAKPERRKRAEHALELVGLLPMADLYPAQLSGGMRQRLALARSLALDVDLLLMDEPLSALDALLREQLQETLLGLWQGNGYAQVLVTHSIEEAVYLGQRIFVFSSHPGTLVGVLDNPDVGVDGYRDSDAFSARCARLRAMLREGSKGVDRRA